MVEIIVASAIITMVVIAASVVAQKAVSLSRQSVHQAQAALLLEEGAESVRIVRDNAWSNISSLTAATDYYISFSGGTWVISTTPNQVGIFTRKITFSPAYRDGSQNLSASGTLDSQTSLVSVIVSWTEGGQAVSKTLQFYITDLFS